MILHCSECGVLEEVSRRMRPRQRCEEVPCTGRLQIISREKEEKIKKALTLERLRWGA